MLWKQVRAFGQLLKVSVSKWMQQNCKNNQNKIWALFATWHSAFPWAVQVQIKKFLRKGTAEPVLMISAPGIKVHKWPKLANNWILKPHNVCIISMAGKWIRSNKYLPTRQPTTWARLLATELNMRTHILCQKSCNLLSFLNILMGPF